MADLRPFRGVRPPKAVVQQLVVPSSDSISLEEARADVRGNPRSFFRICRPEADLAPEAPRTVAKLATLGRHNLESFLAEGWLRQDEAAHFYVYRQRMGDHVQVGLLASVSVAEYDAGLIKPHGPTRPDTEAVRTRHVDALGGNDEPVVLVYRARDALDALVSEAMRGPSEYDFTTEDGIRHSFWCARPELGVPLTDAFRAVPSLYLVEGHHRAAAASRVNALREARREGRGHCRFMAMVFPHDQVRVLEYNRVVKDLHGMSPGVFLERLSERFEVKRGARPRPDQEHRFGMYLEGTWYQLTAKPGTFERTPLGLLDVTLLQQNVLASLLWVGGAHAEGRVEAVPGSLGTSELEARVDSGQFRVAFALFPASIEQVLSVADAGEAMPANSVWLEPRLRSGLVTHVFS
ncbi:DUF1015 family protein [Corallococcus sp. M34]|uniref:DUF1015 domain-containing protein n=1 Tax=Citreicoccus inhibens TaxID=2849499 RepID=UPI0013150857|nr:DUF1015 family protein [Citreicoccus inhibens]MBU8897593.1 DUF1015 family protein [Citreicoccus inhibens]